MLSAIFSLAKFYELFQDSDLGDAQTAARLIKEFKKNNILVSHNGSMTKLIGDFIVEPIMIISDDVRNSEVLSEAKELTLDVFTSFYTQAFQVLTNMHNLDPRVAIRLLSTDKGTESVIALSALDTILSKEDSLYGFMENEFLNLEAGTTTTTNTFKSGSRKGNETSDTDYGGIKVKTTKDSFDEISEDSKSSKSIDTTLTRDKTFDKNSDNAMYSILQRDLNITIEVSNSSYVEKTGGGKSNPVEEITRDGLDDKGSRIKEKVVSSKGVTHSKKESSETKSTRKITVPIIIKAHVIRTSMDNIMTLLSPNSRYNRFGFRLSKYLSGGSSLSEFIFASDLINAYKKDKFADKSKLIELVNKRKLSANSKLLDDTTAIGYEKFYNQIIISDTDKIRLDKYVGGKLETRNYKDNVLDGLGGLTLTVLDDDNEYMTLYTKDINGMSEISYKKLKKNGGSKSNDFDSIMKAMMSNRPPF